MARLRLGYAFLAPICLRQQREAEGNRAHTKRNPSPRYLLPSRKVFARRSLVAGKVAYQSGFLPMSVLNT